jgi:solute carrier family 25 citrate transporter 1
MAAIWQAVVCRMHHVDHWQLAQGRHTYVKARKYLKQCSDADIGFVAFDMYKSLLMDAEGKVSGPATVIAGFGAGATESLLAVTPFESIKTQLIDDRKSANPRMRGFLHGSKIIAQEKGIRGFFQGFLPTTARQAANSAVRFSSYTALKQMAQSYVAPGEKLGAASTFGLGGLAGVITVYTTMPIDTVKTRFVYWIESDMMKAN